MQQIGRNFVVAGASTFSDGGGADANCPLLRQPAVSPASGAITLASPFSWPCGRLASQSARQRASQQVVRGSLSPGS